MYILVELVLLSVLATAASAQTIRGKVIDDITHAAVPRAHISVTNDSGRVLITRTADSIGVFEFPLPRADSFVVKVESLGYEPTTSSYFELARGEVIEVELRLSARALLIEPMTVVARSRPPAHLREFFERADFNRKAGRGRIWMREDLEREGTRRVAPLIAMVPRRHTASCTGSTILLDGLPIEPFELDLIEADELEGVEVYRDALEVPVEYARYCAVVFLWRRPYEEGGTPLTWRRLAIAAGAVGLFLVLMVR